MTTDQIINKFFSLADKVAKLNREVQAEKNHGVGFETIENRKDFIDYFDNMFNEVSKGYDKLKESINHE